MRIYETIVSRVIIIVASILSIRFSIYSFVPKIITRIAWTKKDNLIPRICSEWCFSSVFLFLIYFHGWPLILKPGSSREWNYSIIFFLIILMRGLAFFLLGESSGDFCISPLFFFLLCSHGAQTLLYMCLVVSQSIPFMIRPLSVDYFIQYFGVVLLHISFLNFLP